MEKKKKKGENPLISEIKFEVNIRELGADIYTYFQKAYGLFVCMKLNS